MDKQSLNGKNNQVRFCKTEGSAGPKLINHKEGCAQSKSDPSHIISCFKENAQSNVKNIMENFSKIATQDNVPSARISFSNTIELFNSVNKKNEHQVENCKPSEIKSIHKEKLESILRNKIIDQNALKRSPQNSFLTYDFKKNIKTGEYESLELQKAEKPMLSQNNSRSSKVKDMVARFEAFKDL